MSYIQSRNLLVCKDEVFRNNSGHLLSPVAVLPNMADSTAILVVLLHRICNWSPSHTVSLVNSSEINKWAYHKKWSLFIAQMRHFFFSNRKVLIVFLFLDENLFLWYSMLDCALIGICAVIRSNTVYASSKGPDQPAHPC